MLSRVIRCSAPEFVAPNCSPGETPAPGPRTRSAEYSAIPEAYLHLQEFYHNFKHFDRYPPQHTLLIYSRGNIMLESFSATCLFTISACQLLHQWPLRSFEGIPSECYCSNISPLGHLYICSVYTDMSNDHYYIPLVTPGTKSIFFKYLSNWKKTIQAFKLLKT